jgi:DNA-binding NarL/FixJ family response regulator
VRTVDSCRVPGQHDPIPAQRTATSSVRVLIVDDERFFQNVVHELVDATSGFEWVGAACSGEEGLDEADRLRPDLILMDVRMPGIGGMEAARRMSARGNPAIVVLISAEEALSDASCGAASAIVPKRKLSRALLRRVWEERGEPLVGPQA